VGIIAAGCGGLAGSISWIPAWLIPVGCGRSAAARGCALDVFVDGGEALPRIAEALAGARSHVYIAGWHVTADFGLTRDDRASRLRDLFGDLAERVGYSGGDRNDPHKRVESLWDGR
jgi:hypothetical protein